MTITANIIADSICGKHRITTFELEYPRFIHSEFMTHRLFSRNAASSRAIPVSRAIELIKQDTAMPVHWGKNQPGMSAREECNELIDKCSEFFGHTREDWWNEARDMAIIHANGFDKAGYHKQIVNRILEPFSHIKVVLTSTNFENWFWLRNHKDAQPEIAVLAKKMFDIYEENSSKLKTLSTSQWHVPYYQDGVWSPDINNHQDITDGWFNSPENIVDSYGNTLQDALAISSSCCAQVSYRRLDDSLQKARDIFSRLVESMPPHFSPFEHQATPMGAAPNFQQSGITHMDKYGEFWSGNFRGWIQHRQLIMDK